MANPLIRTLNGWRFELPLALVLGASAAFATIAMPHRLFGRIPGVTASGFERPLQVIAAIVVAVLAAIAGYIAMKRPAFVADAALEDEDDALAAPPIDIPVRLRRADAHPDFPPREPIRASRDLGVPFMKVGRDATPLAPAAEAIPDGEFVELPASGPGEDAPAPVAEDARGDDAPAEPIVEAAAAAQTAPETPAEWPLPASADADIPAATEPAEEPFGAIAAFAPEPDAAIEPTPRPERPHRESLAAMMERLSAGLDRRAGKPVGPPPAAMLAEVLARPRRVRSDRPGLDTTKPDLRDAIDELNRIAARRD